MSLRGAATAVALAVCAYVIIGPETSGRIYTLMSKYTPMWSTPVCLARTCKATTATCFTNFKCIQTIGCVNSCMLDNVYTPEKTAECAYICEMTYGYENKPFIELMGCMLENSCLEDYPDDGICIGSNEDGVKHLTSIADIAGDWWVIRGMNCGQDKNWPGGYDWYPCQHERFTQKPDGEWMNTVTFCGGKADVCTTEIVTTMANVSMPMPGVIKVEYLDAPLDPQIEHWRIVSQPHPDYALVLWCGRLPVLDYSGVLIISRQRNDRSMPAEVLKELRSVTKKFGLNYDEMCPSNNDNCIE